MEVVGHQGCFIIYHDMWHTINISNSQRLYYGHESHSLEYVLDLHRRVTACVILWYFIYLFFSIHQGHSKCLLFSSDLIVYNLGTSLKVHFPLASPSHCFLPYAIKSNEQDLDLATSSKFEKAKSKFEYLVKRTMGLIPNMTMSLYMYHMVWRLVFLLLCRVQVPQ